MESTKAALALSVYWDYAKNLLPFASKGGLKAYYQSKDNGAFITEFNTYLAFYSDSDILSAMKRLANQTPDGMTATTTALKESLISFINRFNFEEVEQAQRKPAFALGGLFNPVSAFIAQYASAVTIGIVLYFITKKK